MARYDPYDRGDNPHRIDIDRIDMPRSKPSAKPKAGGASKSAAAPAKKKAAPASPPRRPKETVPNHRHAGPLTYPARIGRNWAGVAAVGRAVSRRLQPMPPAVIPGRRARPPSPCRRG